MIAARSAFDGSGVPRYRKVLCYVVRSGHLLVFRHRDHPEAGIQVPAGTLHEGEAPENGAIREVEEETARKGFSVLRFVGLHEHEFFEVFRGVERRESHARYVFLLEPPPDLPDRWSHFAEEGNGGFWFDFYWLPLAPGLTLAGEQHALLAELATTP